MLCFRLLCMNQLSLPACKASAAAVLPSAVGSGCTSSLVQAGGWGIAWSVASFASSMQGLKLSLQVLQSGVSRHTLALGSFWPERSQGKRDLQVAGLPSATG